MFCINSNNKYLKYKNDISNIKINIYFNKIKNNYKNKLNNKYIYQKHLVYY